MAEKAVEWKGAVSQVPGSGSAESCPSRCGRNKDKDMIKRQQPIGQQPITELGSVDGQLQYNPPLIGQLRDRSIVEK